MGSTAGPVSCASSAAAWFLSFDTVEATICLVLPSPASVFFVTLDLILVLSSIDTLPPSVAG